MRLLQLLTSVRTERGLLVAGTVIAVALLSGFLIRPAPTGNADQSGQTFDQNAISAKAPPSTTSVAGASSKEAEEEPPDSPTTSTTQPAPLPYTIHEVPNVDAWAGAVAAAQPGDTILLTGNINREIQYRGSRFQPEKQQGADGTAELPITITAAEGVWIDPGNLNNRKPGLDVLYTSHVHVVGIRVRNSQFGIRVQYSNGSPEVPILVADNLVSDIGHAGIHVVGQLQSHEPSQYVRVENNVVTRTGLTAPEFGEGIYLGYGSREWVDLSSDIAVVGNDISFTTAEGIDVKPGTRNVLIEGNLIHDLSPVRGGAISAHYVDNAPNPDPGLNSNLLIRDNRIWNMNLDGRPGANDWAIWVGHGGVTIENNAIWGLRNDPNRTRAVRVRALHDFGPHPIRIVDNVFWTATGWLAEGSPSGANSVQAGGNRGPSGVPGIDVPISPDSNTPPLGSGGLADLGSGPGSSLGFQPTSDFLWAGFEPGF